MVLFAACMGASYYVKVEVKNFQIQCVFSTPDFLLFLDCVVLRYMIHSERQGEETGLEDKG